MDTGTTQINSKAEMRQLLLSQTKGQLILNVARKHYGTLKRALFVKDVSLCDCLARSTLALYLRSYVVVIRHFAPNAEGLVCLHKAGSFQHSHRHGETDSLKP